MGQTNVGPYYSAITYNSGTGHDDRADASGANNKEEAEGISGVGSQAGKVVSGLLQAYLGKKQPQIFIVS